MKTAVVVTVGGIGILILAALIIPLAYATAGYITGWVLAHVFRFAGNWIVDGARLLGLDIPLTYLPHVGAALGFIGAFFKSSTTTKSRD